MDQDTQETPESEATAQPETAQPETAQPETAQPEQEAAAMTWEAPDRFIVSPTALEHTLRDLHRDEQAVMFQNRLGDLTCILQPTCETTDDFMSFDLSCMYDEDKDCHGKIKEIMDLEFNAVHNEEGNWTLYQFTMTNEPKLEDLVEIMTFMNKVYELRICECFQHLIKNTDRNVCYMCTMRSPSTVNTEEGYAECVICNEPIHTPMGSVLKSCCQQTMHKRCLELWRRDDPLKTCPICRKSR
jgi:hypothetical protein